MIKTLASALLAAALMRPAAIVAQEHETPAGKASPANATAPTPPVKATPKQTVGVTPSATATQVAAAIAEALRTAEAAQAKRQAAAPRPAQPRRPVPTTPARRYEVVWPEERTVVQWPATTNDGRVHLAWPE